MAGKLSNKNAPINVLVGLSHRFTPSTKAYVDREEERQRWRKGMQTGW